MVFIFSLPKNLSPKAAEFWIIFAKLAEKNLKASFLFYIFSYKKITERKYLYNGYLKCSQGQYTHIYTHAYTRARALKVWKAKTSVYTGMHSADKSLEWLSSNRKSESIILPFFIKKKWGVCQRDEGKHWGQGPPKGYSPLLNG